MRIEINRPTMREAKEWAATVCEAMAITDHFQLAKADAGSTSEGGSIVLYFVSRQEPK